MPDKDITEFFSQEEQYRILAAIAEAEQNTSGEIRIHLENRCRIAVLDRAAYIFKQIDMQKTAQRNGVLFYLAIKDRKFAILGDGGINSVVEEGFWDSIRDAASSHFKEGRFVDGLVEGILACGKKLKDHFPHFSDDVNELKDEISFGKQ